MELSLPNKKYKVIYADPPWLFKNWSVAGEDRNALQHYDCMTLDQIKQMPVADIADDNSVLFMWATSPLLPQQIEVMTAWGFQYKSIGFNWVKLTKSGRSTFVGMGYYTRANSELCLLGTRGKPGRPAIKNVRQPVLDVDSEGPYPIDVLRPVREHSRKPDCVRDYITDMYEGPRIELFARQTVPGWDTWGNQTKKFNTFQ